MTELADARFELRRVAEREWLILDHKYGANDPRRTVGCVNEIDEDEVDVMWMREIPLPNRYTAPIEALEEVRRMATRSRATRPVPIPHFPPLLAV